MKMKFCIISTIKYGTHFKNHVHFIYTHHVKANLIFYSFWTTNQLRSLCILFLRHREEFRMGTYSMTADRVKISSNPTTPISQMKQWKNFGEQFQP